MVSVRLQNTTPTALRLEQSPSGLHNLLFSKTLRNQMISITPPTQLHLFPIFDSAEAVFSFEYLRPETSIWHNSEEDFSLVDSRVLLGVGMGWKKVWSLRKDGGENLDLPCYKATAGTLLRLR